MPWNDRTNATAARRRTCSRVVVAAIVSSVAASALASDDWGDVPEQVERAVLASYDVEPPDPHLTDRVRALVAVEVRHLVCTGDPSVTDVEACVARPAPVQETLPAEPVVIEHHYRLRNGALEASLVRATTHAEGLFGRFLYLEIPHRTQPVLVPIYGDWQSGQGGISRADGVVEARFVGSALVLRHVSLDQDSDMGICHFERSTTEEVVVCLLDGDAPRCGRVVTKYERLVEDDVPCDDPVRIVRRRTGFLTEARVTESAISFRTLRGSPRRPPAGVRRPIPLARFVRDPATRLPR